MYVRDLPEKENTIKYIDGRMDIVYETVTINKDINHDCFNTSKVHVERNKRRQILLLYTKLQQSSL